jgi:hypothetical protein
MGWMMYKDLIVGMGFYYLSEAFKLKTVKISLTAYLTINFQSGLKNDH